MEKFIILNSNFNTPASYKRLAVEYGADHLSEADDYSDETSRLAQEFILSTIGSTRDAYREYINRENLKALEQVTPQRNIPETEFRRLVYILLVYGDANHQDESIAGYAQKDVMMKLKTEFAHIIPDMMQGKALLACEPLMRYSLQKANEAYVEGRSFDVPDRVIRSIDNGTVLLTSTVTRVNIEKLMAALNIDLNSTSEDGVSDVITYLMNLNKRKSECDLDQILSFESGLRKENYLRNLIQGGSKENVIDAFSSILKGVLIGGSIAQSQIDQISREAKRVAYDVAKDVIDGVSKLVKEHEPE